MTHTLLRVDGLYAHPVESHHGEMLSGLDVTVCAGEMHAIIGPNGSGTSALGCTLMGAPEYALISGSVTLRGDDITDWPVDERAKAGMFLAFRHPQPVAGVSVFQFLRQALSARTGPDLSVMDLRLATMDWMMRIGMDPSVIDRHLDEGFSVGEQQLNELVQLALLEPDLAILEPAAGLDLDEQRLVAQGIGEVRAQRPTMGVILLTNDRRLLDAISADHVHILLDGRIVASGGTELTERLKHGGYDSFRVGAAS